ncbi:TetR/AcrR family transcriptional regulator [Chitinibacteraceae bacterium HSL-7]
MASNDQKIRQILDTALELFVRYGFRKTSMQDIAQTAQISRAALYQVFSSKEEVFHSLSSRVHDDVMTAVEAEFAADLPYLQRLEQGVTAFMVGIMASISASPHGQELLETNQALASDVIAATRQRLLTLMADALQAADAAGDVDLQGNAAQDLAQVILAAMEGIKHAPAPNPGMAGQLALLMQLLSKALRPSSGVAAERR